MRCSVAAVGGEHPHAPEPICGDRNRRPTSPPPRSRQPSGLTDRCHPKARVAQDLLRDDSHRPADLDWAHIDWAHIDWARLDRCGQPTPSTPLTSRPSVRQATAPAPIRGPSEPRPALFTWAPLEKESRALRAQLRRCRLEERVSESESHGTRDHREVEVQEIRHGRDRPADQGAGARR